MENTKNDLKSRFERLYKGCTLYCVQLDGFSHALYYKDANGQRHHEGFSAYAPEQYEADRERYTTDGKCIIWSWNKDITKAFFLGYSHLSYSHGNHKEICYKDAKEW